MANKSAIETNNRRKRLVANKKVSRDALRAIIKNKETSFEERMKAVEEILAIPEGFRAFAIFPLGYPAESRKQQDRFDESRIHFV